MMRYRISEIKIKPRNVAAQGGGISRERLMDELRHGLAKALEHQAEEGDFSEIRIIRESIDARRKPDVRLVYTVEFQCDRKLSLDPAGKPEEMSDRFSARDIKSIINQNPKRTRPVIAGFGPCGIFAALTLAEAGLKPIVLERGKSVEERAIDVEKFWRAAMAEAGRAVPDPESNVQFGEGGAGTFSDGKLTTGIKNKRIRTVLQEFVKAGAPEEIIYRHKPHIGTDRLRKVVRNLRLRIEQLGGEIRFSTRLDGLILQQGDLRAVKLSTGEIIETENLLLAVGHSARDTFSMLCDMGFDMQQKPFSIGVRVEHPQKMINRVQYGDPQLADILGPADYKLSCRLGEDCPDSIAGRGVYTFCMCPGGEVVNASTEAETSVTNGMSNSSRDGEYANSALLVDVRPSDYKEFSRPDVGHDDPLAGMEFQKRYERLAWLNRTEAGMAKATYGQFRDSEENSVRRSLPAFASEAIIEAMPRLGRKLMGFDSDETLMTAVETRSSSPVRILRNENMEASIEGKTVKGIIPAGEGPGYAGGIMSAAVDGIKAAEAVINSTYALKNR